MPATTSQSDHQDWLGTERARTSTSGAVTESFGSLPFGDDFTYNAPEGDWSPYHFAGYDQDRGPQRQVFVAGVEDNSANGHAQFREYSNMAGRWFSPDPYQGSYDPNNPQSFNRYAYVLNSPLSYLDPLGLNCQLVYVSNWVHVNTGDGWQWVDNGGDQYFCTPDGGGNGGSGGSGGGGGGGPNNANKNPFLCGSEAASKISAAAALHNIPGLGSGVGGFIADAVGGNAFSGATDLIHSVATGEGGGHSVFYNMGQGVVAGPTQGFGAAFGSAIDGTPWGADIVSVGLKALPVVGEYATGIGEAKLAYDTLTYFGATAGCALGIVH